MRETLYPRARFKLAEKRPTLFRLTRFQYPPHAHTQHSPAVSTARSVVFSDRKRSLTRGFRDFQLSQVLSFPRQVSLLQLVKQKKKKVSISPHATHLNATLGKLLALHLLSFLGESTPLCEFMTCSIPQHQVPNCHN